jgi:hypothetical protein
VTPSPSTGRSSRRSACPPDELRDLASLIEATRQVVLVRDLVEHELARLPSDHRYVKSLHRLAAWAGNRDAESVQAET